MVEASWVPSHEEYPLKTRAKMAAKEALQTNRPEPTKTGAKTTILMHILRKLRSKTKIPVGIGKLTTDFDKSLPGKHTKQLYDTLKRPKATILA
jgi:hypothetical protein